MLESLAALGILASQQGPVNEVPQEENTVVVQAASVSPQDGAEFVLDEKAQPRSLYLPYD